MNDGQLTDAKAVSAPTFPAYSGDELPQYKCHKIVGAAKVERVEVVREHPNRDAIFVLILEGGRTLNVQPHFYYEKCVTVGGYIVRYEDGYWSFSPADAFEDGYSLIG